MVYHQIIMITTLSFIGFSCGEGVEMRDVSHSKSEKSNSSSISSSDPDSNSDDPTQNDGSSLAISSAAFTSGSPIPRKYGCEDQGGQNTSIPINIKNIPQDAKSIVLFIKNTSASDAVHWNIFNLPVSMTQISEDIESGAAIGDGGIQGVNYLGKNGYDGPCPLKKEEIHEFTFTVFALSSLLELTSTSDAAAVETALSGKKLKEASMTGTFANLSCTNVPEHGVVTEFTEYLSQCKWSCETDYYVSGSSCLPVGEGYYAVKGQGTRLPCTNAKPAHGFYSGSGSGANNCPITCYNGYYPDTSCSCWTKNGQQVCS